MNTITFKSEATITVPEGNWYDIRTGLALLHNERVRNYGEIFITHTDRCNLGALLTQLKALPLPGHNTFKVSGSTFRFLSRLIFEMPATFQGDLIFKCAE